MATSILGTLLSKNKCSFYDSETSSKIWSKLHVMRLRLRDESEITHNPIQITDTVDTGGNAAQTSVESDLSQTKITAPSSVMIEAISLDADLTSSILAIFNNDEILIDIVSRSVSMKSLSISRLDIRSSAEILSGVQIIMELEQAIASAGTSYDNKAEQGADASVIDLGISYVSDVGNSLEEVYSNVTNNMDFSAWISKANILPQTEGILDGSWELDGSLTLGE